MQINLEPRKDWFYTLIEYADSEELFYDISYSPANENDIVFVELIGQGSLKMTRINFNTTKGRKVGDFKTEKPFSNIYFKVEKIKLYSKTYTSFKLSIFSKHLKESNLL
jgi:hypothetical protein